jgi:hypothetical protein
MSLTERTQVLLSPSQRQKVEDLATSSSRSVGAVIRAAIDSYGGRASPETRAAALDELFSLEAPVDDWEVMEREIVAGYHSS